MEISYTEQSVKALEELDNSIRKRFVRHIEKLQSVPPRRHLKFGLPYNVEEVTKQARIIYQIKEEELHILRCFATHKEYEKWYKAYK